MRFADPKHVGVGSPSTIIFAHFSKPCDHGEGCADGELTVLPRLSRPTCTPWAHGPRATALNHSTELSG